MRNRWASLGILALAAALGNFIAYKMVHIPRQIEAALLFGALLLYPVLRSPLLGVYVFFTVSPFISYVRRLYYLAYDRPGMDPLLVVGEIVILFVILGLFFEFREHRSRDPSVNGYSGMVAIYFAFLVSRVFIFQSMSVPEAVAQFKFYGPAVILFFVGVHFSDRFRHLKALWAITVVLGVGVGLYGLKQLYIGYSQAEQLWFNTIDFSTLAIKGVVRPFSIFQAPVAMGDYLQLGIIGIMLLLMWEKRLPFVAFVPAILLFAYTILMTSVRSSWVGLLATPVFLFFFVGVRGQRRRMLVLVLVVIAYVGYESVSTSMGLNIGVEDATTALVTPIQDKKYVDLLVSERSTALTNPFEEHSFLSRLNTWQALLIYTMDPEMALVGRGLGALRADSLYFTYLAEFGYPGMIFIIVILVVFIRRGLQVVDGGGDPRVVALAKGVTVMNLVMALMCVTGSHIHGFPGDAYFWFFNGVLVNSGALERALAAETHPTRIPEHQDEAAAHA